MCGRALCLLALVAISLARSVVSVKDTFPWRRVPLYANRVGPFSNPRCDGPSASSRLKVELCGSY